MSKSTDYTVSVTDGMIVKHGSKLRILLKTENQVLKDDLIDAELLGGELTVLGYMYNRLSYSGGVQWWNPDTGKTIKRPKIQILAREEDIQHDD